MRTLTRIHYFFPLLLACGSSGPTNLIVTGSDFSADDGKSVKIAVVDAATGTAQNTVTATVTGGKFSATIPVDAEADLRVDAFIDRDDSTACEFGIDGAYSTGSTVVAVPEGGTKTVTFASGTTDSQGCLSFGAGSLSVKGTGYGDSQVWQAVLFKKKNEDYIRLGKKTRATAAAAVDIQFPGALVTGVFYRLDFYVDVNGDGMCSAADKVFRIDSIALATGTKTVTLTQDATGTNAIAACDSFK